MYTLVFSIVWTVLAALFALSFDIDPSPEYKSNEWIAELVLTAMPFFGILFIWDSYRKLRRFRGVQCERTDEGTIYVWTELDGSEGRSTVDPRIEWEKEDKNFSDN